MNKTTLFFTATLLFSIQLSAADNTSRYQAWSPPAEQGAADQKKYQNMIDQLNVLINDAEKARAADRHFIQDLRDILSQYDWPWRNTVVAEDFTDGVISKNPKWTVETGKFKMERGLGIHSQIEEARVEKKTEEKRSSEGELAAVLLGALLESATKDKDKDDQPSKQETNTTEARISVAKPIQNAFAIKTTVDSRSKNGKAGIRTYVNKSTGNYYHVVFNSGDHASLELQRVTSHGTSIIAAKDNIQAKGNRTHQLEWTRDKLGNMKIALNGKTVIQAADRSFKKAFNGFSFSNLGGDFYLQSVNISDIK